MEYFQIRGAGPLRGETAVSGAKNAALPILAACVLCRGPCVLYNCPEIADVETTLAILRALGAKAERCCAAVVVDAAGQRLPLGCARRCCLPVRCCLLGAP